MTQRPDDRHEDCPPEGAGHAIRRRLDPETRRRIGRSLRILYADLLAQPLPARFEALLADLAAKSKPEEPSR
ncbi:NepR family anti-sigma factor [Methylobacterium nigriterrae]|uniref:NepR family anti-sigma factor n=1 Tax=Methylobacterium nigriterrae TaxID=3127512 RepID=UPI00301354F5